MELVKVDIFGILHEKLLSIVDSPKIDEDVFHLCYVICSIVMHMTDCKNKSDLRADVQFLDSPLTISLRYLLKRIVIDLEKNNDMFCYTPMCIADIMRILYNCCDSPFGSFFPFSSSCIPYVFQLLEILMLPKGKEVEFHGDIFIDSVQFFFTVMQKALNTSNYDQYQNLFNSFDGVNRLLKFLNVEENVMRECNSNSEQVTKKNYKKVINQISLTICLLHKEKTPPDSCAGAVKCVSELKSGDSEFAGVANEIWKLMINPEKCLG
jgi:hypothetical protein